MLKKIAFNVLVIITTLIIHVPAMAYNYYYNTWQTPYAPNMIRPYSNAYTVPGGVYGSWNTPYGGVYGSWNTPYGGGVYSSWNQKQIWGPPTQVIIINSGSNR